MSKTPKYTTVEDSIKFQQVVVDAVNTVDFKVKQMNRLYRNMKRQCIRNSVLLNVLIKAHKLDVQARLNYMYGAENDVEVCAQELRDAMHSNLKSYDNMIELLDKNFIVTSPEIIEKEFNELIER